MPPTRSSQTLRTGLPAGRSAPQAGDRLARFPARRAPRLARIAGIDVHVDWSLAIIFFLIVTSLAGGLFPAWHPDWNGVLSVVVAVAAALLFFGSVLAHELSHSLVGRAYGMQVRRITLFIFGGMAHLEDEPRDWKAELWMAIVGPLTSLAIGAACLGIAGLTAGSVAVAAESPAELFASLGPVPTLLVWLGQVNAVLAIFNLVPGFPLDGGRVLRAVTWGVTGDLRRATRIASGAGQGFAWLLIALGISMVLGLRVPVFGTGLVNGLWLCFIGWFLNNAALMSYRQLLTREALDDVPVSRLMATRFETVTPDTSVERLIEDCLLHSQQRAFPVVEGERLVGLVCRRDVDRLEDAFRATTPVSAIMTPVHELSVVTPQADAFDVLGLLAEREVNQLPVVESGRILGLVRREDVLKWLALNRRPRRARGF